MSNVEIDDDRASKRVAVGGADDGMMSIRVVMGEDGADDVSS